MASKMMSHGTGTVQIREESGSGIRKWEEMWFKTTAEYLRNWDKSSQNNLSTQAINQERDRFIITKSLIGLLLSVVLDYCLISPLSGVTPGLGRLLKWLTFEMFEQHFVQTDRTYWEC